jgi:tryptophanyl-tRNA synthetase
MPYKVTPWKVEGEVDYSKLIKEFGTAPLTPTLLNQIKKHTQDLHLYLRRGLFFSHRNLDWILNKYEKGEKFFLYTGRGPSGHTHIGHLVPWIFTKHLQDKFRADVLFQLTDDEKSLVKPNLDLDTTTSLAYENMLDVIAIGFKAKKTQIFINTIHANLLYPLSVKIAKHVTLSTAKAIFGFKDSSNIGINFFPAMQAAPAFLPSIKAKKNIPCLIPCAIDQDPYWRIARDVAPKLGFYKPAAIHSKFLPGLKGDSKMSSSIEGSCIYTTDTKEDVEQKIKNTFTGGQASIAEQKKLGGLPEKCIVYTWLYYLFEEDDRQIKEVYKRCKSGSLMCGDCKQGLACKIITFLKKHQKAREKARNKIDHFLASD